MLIKPITEPACLAVRGGVIMDETTPIRTEKLLLKDEGEQSEHSIRTVLTNATHTLSRTCREYSEGWLIWPELFFFFFLAPLGSSVPVVFAPLNSQMCIRLCNEGFMHCKSTIISLNVAADRPFSLTVWSRSALTFSVTWRTAALLLSCFSLPKALVHKYHFVHLVPWFLKTFLKFIMCKCAGSKHFPPNLSHQNLNSDVSRSFW